MCVFVVVVVQPRISIRSCHLKQRRGYLVTRHRLLLSGLHLLDSDLIVGEFVLTQQEHLPRPAPIRTLHLRLR